MLTTEVRVLDEIILGEICVSLRTNVPKHDITILYSASRVYHYINHHDVGGVRISSQ